MTPDHYRRGDSERGVGLIIICVLIVVLALLALIAWLIFKAVT